MNEENMDYSVMHIASFVFGVISILTALFWYITLPTGILAIVFGIKSTKRTGSKVAKAGFVTGIIGLSLFAFIYIGMILIIISSNVL